MLATNAIASPKNGNECTAGASEAEIETAKSISPASTRCMALSGQMTSGLLYVIVAAWMGSELNSCVTVSMVRDRELDPPPFRTITRCQYA